jgi:hypothetical protein
LAILGVLISAVNRLGGTLDEGTVGASHSNGLHALFLVGLNAVLYLLALSQAAEALGMDGALVNEHVRATVGGGDEAESFLGVEPLAGSFEFAISGLGRGCLLLLDVGCCHGFLVCLTAKS